MVCAAGLYGDFVTVGHGSKGGWDNFGPERLVTRSQGNVLVQPPASTWLEPCAAITVHPWRSGTRWASSGRSASSV